MFAAPKTPQLSVSTDRRSCFSAANCAWQVDAWQLCNVSCGIGHQAGPGITVVDEPGPQ